MVRQRTRRKHYTKSSSPGTFLSTRSSAAPCRWILRSRTGRYICPSRKRGSSPLPQFSAMTKRELLERFKIPDAFADAEPVESATLWGWDGEHPVFETVIAEVRQMLITEVGSWMAPSPVSMPPALKKPAFLGPPIFCVDTGIIGFGRTSAM